MRKFSLSSFYAFGLLFSWFRSDSTVYGDIEAEGHLMFPLTFQSVCGSSHGMTFSF